MHIQDIRNKAPFEEIDYPFLKDCLKDYAQPRMKIRSYLQSKDLIKVKKGLYIFGEKAAREPYSKELLANLIYGPSAISLEYALSFHGLIPERLEEITSITSRRNKEYDTPVGRFSYHYLSISRYPIGITQEKIMHNRNILIATKEKALCDMLCLKCKPLKTESMLIDYLFEDLRIDDNIMQEIDSTLLEALAKQYKNVNVFLLHQYYMKYKGNMNA